MSNIPENCPVQIVRVALQRPIYKLLDYHCNFEPLPEPGCRVQVPLGNSRVVALVVQSGVKTDIKQLKSVIRVLDHKPLLDPSMLALLNWASRYYLYPPGEVLFHALPALLRKGKAIPREKRWSASQTGKSLPENKIKRAPKQYAMLQLLKQGEYGAQALQGVFGQTWRTILRQLEKKDYTVMREVDEPVFEATLKNDPPAKKALRLTAEQQHCIAQIRQYFLEDNPKPVLLHGITGSGKTEVYCHAIMPILRAGKQALVLVPEIGLTPQLLYRFREHFPQYTIASLHSALADGDRLRVWRGAASGKVDIIIGTRSAVFTPLKNPGVILIDEEHDASFKQQEGFLYQGRDMAIKRAFDAKIPVLLGSATPALESLHNVNNKRYHYLRLANRPGARQRPEMEVLDVRSLPLQAGISSQMMKQVGQHIRNNNQVMLFLNRRGFAPVLMCPECGWHATCPHCDMGMTYHAAASKIICHHCGVDQAVSKTCPECNSDKITTLGQGTERIEQVLNTHFPETPVIRIDRDSTSRKGSLQRKLEQVHQGEPVILIGTQMLTKGHDFPNLTLVGILDVDQALFSIDYRAQERLAQQVIQVAGRAGRGQQKGCVILQTSQPQHPLLINLLSLGYFKTAQQILNERQQWSYPPFGSQALIRVSTENAEAGMGFLMKFRSVIQSLPELTPGKKETELFGPVPSPLYKRANRFRFQILLTSTRRTALHELLEHVLGDMNGFRKKGGLRWSIDIDPSDFL